MTEIRIHNPELVQVSQDRLPPHSPEAERAVLSCMLRDNRVIDEVVQIIQSAEFFYFDAHQKIYQSIIDLRHRQTVPVDLVTLAEALAESGQIVDIGEAPYVYLAQVYDTSGASSNAEHYANIVKEKYLLRSLESACSENFAEAQRALAPASELIEECEKRIFAVADVAIGSRLVPLSVPVGECFTRMDERAAMGESLPGASTGIHCLDDLTGGWQSGELILIAARPSVGKTALCISLARHCARTLSVLFASLEQSRVELVERMLCAEAQVMGHLLKRGMLNQQEYDRVAECGQVLRQLPLFIDDTGSQSVLRIASNARRLSVRAGQVHPSLSGPQPPLGLIVIDYVQLVDPEDKRASREEQVGQIARRLKMLAKELHVPIIALAQLNRQSENRTDNKPRLSDLRDSGQLEMHSDTVLLLHKSGYDSAQSNPDDLTVIVAKQRNGPVGDIVLRFDRGRMKFSEYGTGPTPFDNDVSVSQTGTVSPGIHNNPIPD